MTGFFKRHLTWRKKKKMADEKVMDDPVPDILKIARRMEKTIDGLVSKVFQNYHAQLLEKDIVYIVPAIWGGSGVEELDATQAAIHRMVIPKISDAVDLMELNGASPGQRFAVDYLVRSLVISKIVYMVESTRRRQLELVGTAMTALADAEPAGRA